MGIKLFIIFLVGVLIFFSGCIKENSDDSQIPAEKYCKTNEDCTIQSTDNCCGREAVNKKYSKGLHQICEMLCPDYNTKCINNVCTLGENTCSLSLCDCKCYLKGETPEEKTGRLCGINCMGEYGITGCEYKDGSCEEIFLEEKKCETDADCFEENSKCSDGIDPYHFCDNGFCETRIFVRDPCLDHICPKGTWKTSNDTSCFTYANCAKTGCNDNSETTRDECISIGSRSEGCLYTISNQTCLVDEDCLPAQCCHPTSCTSRSNLPNCLDVACSMDCKPETMDCGQGVCVCLGNKCQVQWS